MPPSVSQRPKRRGGIANQNKLLYAKEGPLRSKIDQEREKRELQKV